MDSSIFSENRKKSPMRLTAPNNNGRDNVTEKPKTNGVPAVNGDEENNSALRNPNDLPDSDTNYERLVNNNRQNTNKTLPDVLINDESNNGRIKTLQLAKPHLEDINIGFNLTRSQWDPYPWVKCVDKDSYAERAGLKEGDCLIKVGEVDLLGLKIGEVANLVRSQQNDVKLLVWSAGITKDGDSDSLLLGPLPLALTRLSSCLASILRAAECPVCARTIPAPAHQCPSGHLLCTTCRSRMEYCPLCRSALGRCRNLLADEVYNCVLENFDLRPDKKERLTKKLFGEDVKFIETTRSLGNLQDTSRQVKWGTQKLLDRLLPGRARSTGNIARIGTRNRALDDERDVSRSLSNLDIARCSTEVSPCHSLPSTAAGSYDSLHQNVRYAVDQNEISSRAVRHETVIRYNCPVDSSCRGTIAGDLQSHIILSHDVEVLLKHNDGHFKLNNNTNGTLVSLLHKSGLWFYPKYFRDERNKGVKIWCWVMATGNISAKYQMKVEVRKKINYKSNKDNSSANGVERNGVENTKVVVSAMIHNSNKSGTVDIIASDEIIVETPAIDVTDANFQNDYDDGICIITENCSNAAKSYIRKVSAELIEKEPILNFSAPVVSLVDFGWNEVLNSGNKYVFLNDCILGDDVEAIATVEETN